MGINCARVDHAFVAPDVIEQTIARLHTPAPLNERAQKFEFDAGEIDTLAFDRNVVASGINRNRAGCEPLVVLPGFAAAQDGFNPQGYFARTERLRHVIIRPKFQPNDAIDFLRFRRQHHDWNVSRCGVSFENFANL